MEQAFAGFRRTEVAGVPVLWMPDPRFKTFAVSLSARRPLDERTAARSLLPAVMLQGTANYPDRPALARLMESLYGAVIAPGTAKEGEVHVLRFALDSVAGSYLPGRPDLLGDGFEFLTEFLARPRLDDGGIPEEVFRREQIQAAHHARAVFDDRGSYAAERCLTLACEGEPMAIPEHGGVAAIEAMTRSEPDAARRDFLRHGELLVTAMGALPPDDEFLAAVHRFLLHLPDREPGPIQVTGQRVVEGRRATIERVDLQQSKMLLLFRLSPSPEPKMWMGRALFASMLGGGPHSRLFREVREKRSLAYYAQAALDRHKALLTIHVGLDESAAEAVEAETMRQSEELMAGDFTAEELDTARAGILSSIATVTDGIRPHMRFVEDQWNLGVDRTPADLFRSYAEITADDVVAGASDLILDYSYLLAPTSPAPTPARAPTPEPALDSKETDHE